MLMQNFKSAVDLGITEPQLSALQKTLVMLETGKLAHVNATKITFMHGAPQFDGLFSMSCWGSVAHDCGTVACIGGTAEMIGDVSFGPGFSHEEKLPVGLYELFYLPKPVRLRVDWNDISTSEAATALRSYLTTGDARWDLAVA